MKAGFAEWGRVLETEGVSNRAQFFGWCVQLGVLWGVLALASVWMPDVVPVGSLLLHGFGWTLLLFFTLCGMVNGCVRRLRDAGVPLLLPATLVFLMCLSVVFDFFHVLSMDWYQLAFWSGNGLSKILEYMMLFFVLTVLSTTIASLSLPGQSSAALPATPR